MLSNPEVLRRGWGLYQSSVPRWQKLALEALMPLLRILVSKIFVSIGAGEEEREKARKNMHKIYDEASFHVAHNVDADDDASDDGDD